MGRFETAISRFAIMGLAASTLMHLGCSGSGNNSNGDSVVPAGGGGSSSSEEAKVYSPFNVNKYPLNKVICEPFNGNPVNNLEGGVKASLYYRGADQARWYTVDEYINKGVKSVQSLFFSEIFVPTRIFSLGFPTETGDIVKTDAGLKLDEYFGLRFEGRLRLGSDDAPGKYEIALLSDDGTILTFGKNTDKKVIVSNDGDHSTKFACGQKVDMTAESLVPFELKYYQGPRQHIAVIPMWRLVGADTKKDSLCGVEGNGTFFDYNNNSKPKKSYTDLLARGWKPWGKENLVLPTDDDHNPCYAGEIPAISRVSMSYDEDLGLELKWTTSIPATAQLLIKNITTGAEELTTSDNILRTEHHVKYTNELDSGDYEVRIVSISATYGKAVSAPLSLKVW